MSFTSLLIQRCTIQSKTLALSGYEQATTWANVATDVPCRKDSMPVRVLDTEIRQNTDDDMFFFGPAVSIERGNRIILEGENYDVIDVNKVQDSTGVHHLEVTGRKVDHD